MEVPKDNELSIVLPVFNEEAIIDKTIREIYDYAKSFIGNVEIIAVNDGSTDGTLRVLDQSAYSLSNLKIVSHAHNRGYGEALRSGIKAAQNPWVLLMDADGQFHIDSLGGLWPCRLDYDVLLGYRRKRTDSFYRVVLGGLGNTLSKILLSHPIRDINCGFKIFKREVICSLPLSSKGGIINFEILYRLFKKYPSIKLNQYPIEHYPRESGKAKGGKPNKIFKIIVEGIKIIFGG